MSRGVRDDTDKLRAREKEAALLAEIEAMPCEMYHEPPFDFAYCERHDTTFALGDICKYGKAER